MGIRLNYSVPISLRTAAIVLGIVLLFLFVKSFYRSDEWQLFDSNPTRYTTEYPDGYKIEYPANWDTEVYKGYHNQKDLRAVFRQPFSSNPRGLEVYWYSQNEMDSQSIIKWGDEIMSGWTTPKATPLVTQTIGVRNYTAVKKEYSYIGKQNDYQVSYFIIDDNEAFMLAFYAKDYDEQTEAIFERMLASFDIYK